MSDASKIVVENYPVNRLPEELQQRVGRDKVARVTIEAVRDMPDRDLVSFVGSGRGQYPTPEDALAAIRTLRDEWK